jgi:glycosyltransferase involved in cell wall biosynthesis
MTDGARCAILRKMTVRRGAGMADLTAVILTRNEQDNIALCIDSLRGFAARVVAVDSGSTDDTAAIARARGAEGRR